MNHPAMLDALSAQYAGQYRTLLAAITGLFARVLDSADPTSPKARSEFKRSLDRLARNFLAGFSDQIEVHTVDVRDAALKTVGRPLRGPELRSLNEHLQSAQDDLKASLWACLTRDCRIVERELRNFAHSVDLIQSAGGVSRVGAIIRSKFGRVSRLSFNQVDRLGRKRASDAFVGTMIRHHLVLARVESQMFSIAKAGIDLVQVQGADDRVVSITGTTPGYESYDEVRDILFHPNSSATVVAYQE